MNKFELFTMIYFALDAYLGDIAKEDDKYLTILSDMNPFVWDDEGSADPAEYAKFCDFIGTKEITLDNSLDLAKEYVKTIAYADVTAAFIDITNESWQQACKDYLATEHKGQFF